MQRSLGGLRTPRLCHNNNVNLSLRLLPLLASFPSSLALFLSLSSMSGAGLHRLSIVGDNLPGTQKELTT